MSEASCVFFRVRLLLVLPYRSWREGWRVDAVLMEGGAEVELLRRQLERQ